MNLNNLVYVITCISFTVIIGAGIYEHVAIWPHAFSEPPKSLTIFQGAYALNSAPFWKYIHPITLALFIITLILNWHSARRFHVLIPMAVYVIVIIVTFTFFVPELISMITTKYSDTIDESLQQRGNMWINLSLIRLLILLVMAIVLLMGLIKPGIKLQPPLVNE